MAGRAVAISRRSSSDGRRLLSPPGPAGGRAAVAVAVRAHLRLAIEVLGGAADGALAGQLDQARAAQLGDVIVDVAERHAQLVAEVAGGEGSAAVHPQHFED